MSSTSSMSVKKAYPILKEPAIEEQLGPAIQFDWKADEQTGKKHWEISLSDGTKVSKETYHKLEEALKKATGTKDGHYGFAILTHVARGSDYQSEEERLTRTANMLPVFRPQDETEAMLAGQFLSLQEAGNKYLRLAGIQDGFYHLERYIILSNKLFNTANQTMQTLIKYRSRGQQVVQVVHLHNEGQAIVAQNLSPNTVEGSQKKN